MFVLFFSTTSVRSRPGVHFASYARGGSRTRRLFPDWRKNNNVLSNSSFSLRTGQKRWPIHSRNRNFWARYFILMVLTAMTMKRSVFWGVTKCSPVKVNRRFGRIFLLHLEDQRVREVRNQEYADNKRILKMGDMFHRNVDWLSPRLNTLLNCIR
jgi:hypothetical protein